MREGGGGEGGGGRQYSPPRRHTVPSTLCVFLRVLFEFLFVLASLAVLFFVRSVFLVFLGRYGFSLAFGEPKAKGTDRKALLDMMYELGHFLAGVGRGWSGDTTVF